MVSINHVFLWPTEFRSKTPRLGRVPFKWTPTKQGSVHKHHDWTGFRSQTPRLKRVPFTNTTIGQGSVHKQHDWKGFRSQTPRLDRVPSKWTPSKQGSVPITTQLSPWRVPLMIETKDLPYRLKTETPKTPGCTITCDTAKKNLSRCLLHRTPLPRTVVGQFRYPHLYTII